MILYWRFWSAVAGIMGDRVEDTPHLAPMCMDVRVHPPLGPRADVVRPAYDPPTLRGFKLVQNEARSRWTWIKEWTGSNGEIRRKKVYE